MTRTLSPKTETLLQEMALGLGCRRTRWLSALRGTDSRTVPFEEVLALWKLKRAAHANLPERTGILLL